MEKIEQLIEDYKIKLKTITEMIFLIEKDLTPREFGIVDPQLSRYKTKQGCYRTFIAELEKIKTEIK
jgi:hypothetical protein